MVGVFDVVEVVVAFVVLVCGHGFGRGRSVGWLMVS